MKNRTSALAAVLLGVLLTTSCGDEDGPSSPTAPSGINAATATSPATPNAAQPGTPAPGTTEPTGPNTANSTALNAEFTLPATSQWNYGAPMPPSNLRLEPTGVESEGALFVVNASWDSPAAFNEGIHAWRGKWREVGSATYSEGQNTGPTQSDGSSRSDTTLRIPKGTWIVEVELANAAGWGLPNDVYAVVGMPRTTPKPLKSLTPSVGVDVNPAAGSGLRRALVILVAVVNTKTSPWVTEVESDYWPEFNRSSVSEGTTTTAGTDGVPGSNTRQFTFAPILPEGRWILTARAKNELGWGPRISTKVTITGERVGGGPPRTVRDLSTVSTRRRHAQVTWTPPEEDGTEGVGGLPIRSYEYAVNNTCSKPRRLVTRPRQLYSPKATYTINLTLGSGTQHVSVRAVNSLGAGPCSTVSVNVQ